MTRNAFATLVVSLAVAAFASVSAGDVPSPGAGGGPPPRHGASKAPERVRLVKMISWAEPVPKGCEADLEGTAAPARFHLAYTEANGRETEIRTDADRLFEAGWEVITRSDRGLGFEKRGEFTRLDFDIVEELRCKCVAKGGPAWQAKPLVHVKVDWKPGAVPSLRATLRDGGGEPTEVRPVTINGRLAMYEIRFARPLPNGVKGECASRFLLALELDQPID